MIVKGNCRHELVQQFFFSANFPKNRDSSSIFVLISSIFLLYLYLYLLYFFYICTYMLFVCLFSVCPMAMDP